MLNIIIGSDHAGYSIKNSIIDKYFISSDDITYNIIDIGPFNENKCDYPDIAHKLCKQLLLHENEGNKVFGILICGTGIGMSITANKHKGIRCALCHNEYTAEMARLHNNANVLGLGVRVLNEEQILKIVNKFINTVFEGGRHETRVNKIEL